MIKKFVSDYSIIEDFSHSELIPMGNSVSPKEIIFHILDDNSKDVSVLDIGFGAGTLGQLVKSNPDSSH
jgi:hypothetical protein